MDIDNNRVVCNCKEIQEKLISLLKDNGNLLQMIRESRGENERLRNELKGSGSGQAGLRPERTIADSRNAEIQSLIEINHGWKTDYEELQMRHEMLSGEKKLIEEEEKELRDRVSELERRQGPLESEIARLAGALYAQNTCEGAGYDDEQCDILKTQISVYKEDFERERVDREKLHEEKEKLKTELEGAEEIIKKLTTELDASKANERAIDRVYVRQEDGYVSVRDSTSHRHRLQLVVPNHSPAMSNERWRYEQHRRGILPRNPPPTSFFYGGDVEVDS